MKTYKEYISEANDSGKIESMYKDQKAKIAKLAEKYGFHFYDDGWTYVFQKRSYKNGLYSETNLECLSARADAGGQFIAAIWFQNKGSYGGYGSSSKPNYIYDFPNSRERSLANIKTAYKDQLTALEAALKKVK